MKNMLRTAGRAGFTLIEILVVIAIIGILISLLLVGVMGFLGKGPEMVTRNDITQLNNQMQKFKTDYKLPNYPPDQLKLCMNYTDYNLAVALDQQSVLFISQMFPQFGPAKWVGTQWAGPGVTLPKTGVILEGDQVLVFCLGGPPAGANTPALMGGWSKIPTDPVNAGNVAPTDRVNYFNFNAGNLKLVSLTPTGAARNNTADAYFPSYIDGYNKTPYVYFSSGVRPNGYSGAANSLGVSAYWAQAHPQQFQNPNTFQIISAGLDGQFGPGGIVWPAAVAPPGADDMTNFTGSKLGNAP